VIGADQFLRAPFESIGQARSAVAANIVEGADRSVVAANGDDVFAKQFQTVPVASARNIADMAYDLPAGADHCVHFLGEETAVMIDPAGQTHPVQRVGVRSKV
jgi:hypothetical protein